MTELSPAVSLLPFFIGYFVLTLAVCSLGFRHLVYFVSIGYAFSIALMALLTIILFLPGMRLLALIQCGLLGLWGMRLGLFLVRRQQQPSYLSFGASVREQYAGVELGRSVIIWFSVSLLYVAMFIPALYHAAAPRLGAGFSMPLFGQILPWVGLLLMLSGLAIETIADRQKSAFKAAHPRDFCGVGLYGWVRCPNYLGEITFWLGSGVMGAAFLLGWLAWVASLMGLAGLVLIMLGSTKRLEAAQLARYGEQPAYRAYIRSVRVLFPFVPLYSLQNWRVVLE